MPDTTKDRGIVGESFKGEWMRDVAKAQAAAREAEYRASLPKGMAKSMPMSGYEPPWASLGQAPTEKQLEREAYGGSA